MTALRAEVAQRRAELHDLQFGGDYHPCTRRMPPRHHFNPESGVNTSTCCPRCPVRRVCRALSVELAELESRLLSGEVP